MFKNIFENKYSWLVLGIVIGAILVYLMACKGIKDHEAKAKESMQIFLANHANATGQEILDVYKTAMGINS